MRDHSAAIANPASTAPAAPSRSSRVRSRRGARYASDTRMYGGLARPSSAHSTTASTIPRRPGGRRPSADASTSSHSPVVAASLDADAA